MLFLVYPYIVLRRLELRGKTDRAFCAAFTFSTWGCRFSLNASLLGLADLLREVLVEIGNWAIPEVG